MGKEVNISNEKIDYIEANYLKKSDKTIASEIDEKVTLVRTIRMKYGWKKQRQTKGHYELFNENGEKWCWYCNEYHDVSWFNKNKNKPSGYQDECKIGSKQMALKRKHEKEKKKSNKIKEKQCSNCGEIKEIDNFIKSVSTEDGYSNKCKECLNKINNRFKIEER